MSRTQPEPRRPPARLPAAPQQPLGGRAARRPHRPQLRPSSRRARARRSLQPGRATAHLARSTGPPRSGSTQGVAGARTRAAAAAAAAAAARV